MNWADPISTLLWYQVGAALLLTASLLVFVFGVALPVHRLVKKLADYARSRGDVVEGAFKNDADVLAHVFKLLTEDVQKKEQELQTLYERARDRARFMERFSERIVESVPMPLVGIDEKGNVESLNVPAEAFFRLRLAAVSGKPVAEVFRAHPDIGSWLGEAVVSRSSVQGRRLSWKTPDGDTVMVEASGAPLPEGEGRGGGYVALFTDRTALERLETQARSNERLEALVGMSAGLAHQFRNPLGGVLGYTDLILKKIPPEGEVADLARSVREDALVLKKVVDDFIEFLRERAAAETSLRWSETVEAARKDLEKDLRKKDVALHLDASLETSAVGLDRVSAYQVAFNLLLNAVEAAPPGGRVEARCATDPERGDTILTVEDNGTGVPDGLKDRIFLPFVSGKPEGRGLGLSVVQRAVQAAHGRVEVGRSPLGGARFTVTLPSVASSIARPVKGGA